MPPEHNHARDDASVDDAHLNPRQKLERSRQALHRALYPNSAPANPPKSSVPRFMAGSDTQKPQPARDASRMADASDGQAPQPTRAEESILTLLGKLAMATSAGHTVRHVNATLTKAAATAGRVIARRWQHHPAHVALQVGQPLLQRAARKRPFQLLAGAAALGALVVLARPWRMQEGSRRIMRAGLADELRILGATGLMHLLTPSRRKR